MSRAICSYPFCDGWKEVAFQRSEVVYFSMKSIAIRSLIVILPYFDGQNYTTTDLLDVSTCSGVNFPWSKQRRKAGKMGEVS